MAEDPMGNAANQAADQMRAGAQAIGDNGAELGLKMIEQAEINTQEAFRAMRAAAQASDISEVMRIQTDFIREQGSRSVAQAREIGELIASFGRTAMGRFTGRD